MTFVGKTQTCMSALMVYINIIAGNVRTWRNDGVCNRSYIDVQRALDYRFISNVITYG